MDQNEQNSFNNSIRENTASFAKVAAEMLEAMFEHKCLLQHTDVLTEGLSTDKNFFISIFFTGMVYGEYVLAMNEDLAAKIIAQSLDQKSGHEIEKIRQDIFEAFCELLNMTVGQSITDLSHIYKKLTITPPRTSFGTLHYPKILMGRSVLFSEKGEIDCYLYVDRMKLDIASSYKEALGTVLMAHKDLKAAMQRLQAQQAILVQSEKMAALGTMAAGVAHEINNPLSTVAIVGGRMKDAITSEEPINKITFLSMLDIVENTVFKISKITNGMRDFAHGVRSESPKISHVNDILSSALLLSEQNIKEHNIELICKLSDKEISIECRAPEISQVLHYIVDNACDAIQDLQVKWIKIRTDEREDSVIISVTDSGAGISEKIKKNIFDPFFTTKQIGSAGLGLSIAKGLVENHSGQISIDSTSGNTSFIIQLPKKAKLKQAV